MDPQRGPQLQMIKGWDGAYAQLFFGSFCRETMMKRHDADTHGSSPETGDSCIYTVKGSYLMNR